MKLSHALPIALASLALTACPKNDTSDAAKAPARATETKDTQDAQDAKDVLPATKNSAIDWIHDDYERAREQAKAEKKPIVIDLWAPWCHTCLSMQETVLQDAKVTARREQFVWLALDTDKPTNASALQKLPQLYWPTFYALSPAGDVLARHVGAASVEELVAFLDRAKATDGEVTKLLRQADALAAEGQHKAAAERYQAALKAGGPSWEGRFAVRVSLLEVLRKGEHFAACAEAGRAHLDDMAGAMTANAAVFTSLTVTCSRRAGRADHTDLLARATAEDGPIRTVLAAEGAALSDDDRSDALRILRNLEAERGNADEAKRLAEAQAQLLEEAVQKLDDPRAVMMFHWPRIEVARYLGRGEELVDDLEQSMRALPGEYEPPYRLAWLLTKLGRHDDAVAPAKQAVQLSYGPRQVRAQMLLADIHAARKDVAAEREARAGVIKLLEALPVHQRSDAELVAAKEKLAALSR